MRNKFFIKAKENKFSRMRPVVQSPIEHRTHDDGHHSNNQEEGLVNVKLSTGSMRNRPSEERPDDGSSSVHSIPGCLVNLVSTMYL